MYKIKSFTFQGLGKKMVLMLLALSFFVEARAQQKFVIKGDIEGLSRTMKVMLTYAEGNKLINDSTVTKDGKFTLEGTINKPCKVYLSLRSTQPEPQQGAVAAQIALNRDAQSFYLVPGTTIIKAKSLKSAVIDNTTEREYLSLQKQLKPLDELMEANDKRWIANKDNKDSVKIYQAKRMALYRAMDNARQNFVITNPNSYVSLDYIMSQYHVIANPEMFEAMYDGMSADFKNSADGKIVKEAIDLTKRFAIGQRAIEFTQNDTSGSPVALASLKGKYILIDFWASWCGPCRAEYPYLHKAYDKFKGKNFEIIGVSLDDKRALWTNSIKQNKFDWLEVCDLKGHQNEVVREYGINAIPQSLLLDPQGFIIAKNLRGDDLVEKLEDVIGNKN